MTRIHPRSALIGTVGAFAVLVAGATSAVAHTIDSVTASPAAVTPGTTVTVTGQWTADSTNDLDATLSLPPALQAGAVWESASGVRSGSGSVNCVWDSPTYEAAAWPSRRRSERRSP